MSTAFVRSVLQQKPEQRPTAREVLKDPFLVRTRGEIPVNNPHYTFSTPQRSRLTSLEPSNIPSWQSLIPQGSRQTSLGPSNAPSRQSPTPQGLPQPSLGASNAPNRQSSAAPSDTSGYQAMMATYRGISPGLLAHIDSDNFDWNDLTTWHEPSISQSSRARSPAVHSGHGSTRSGSTRFASSSLAVEDGTSTQYDSYDRSNVTGEPGSSRSRFRSGGDNSPMSDWATGTVGRIDSQREAEIEEDSGEETETGKSREPATKKSRRSVDESAHQRNLRSRGKKPR